MKVKINILLFMIAAILLIVFSFKAEAVTYTVTDLGALETEDYESWFNGMNDVGQLVGSYNGHAYIWEDGSWTTDLGIFPVGDYSWADAINNSSVVIGTSIDKNALGLYIHQYYMFMWDETNGMTDLGSFPDGKNSKYPNDINENNQVVGSALASNGQPHAFFWENDVLVDLHPYLFADIEMSWANAINDSGYIVGGAYDDDVNQNFAYMWDSEEEELIDLGSLAGEGATARDINDAGYIIGDSADETGIYHGFIWYDGVMTDLGSFGGFSNAIDINNSNEVIGVSENELGELFPYIWDSTNGMRNLLDLLDLGETSEFFYLDLIALNNNGQILASGGFETEGAVEHGYLLTPDYSGDGGEGDGDGGDGDGGGSGEPVPEPASLLLLGIGALGIGLFRRKR